MKHEIVDSDLVIRSMRKSVAKALERKRRLGQYAVVSQNGKLVRLQADEIPPQNLAEDPAPYNNG